MKLLVISYWFPYPPINGAKIRTYQLFRHLAQKHDIDLLAFAQEDQDLIYVDKLCEFCREVRIVKTKPFKPSMLTPLKGLLSIRSRSSVECYSPEMASLVCDLLQKNCYDAVLACTLRAADYLVGLDHPPAILDEDNAEAAYIHREMERQGSRLGKFRHKMTWVKARIHEHRTAARFDAVTAVSEDDRLEIQRVVPELARAGKVFVVPNGVDLELLDYQPRKKDRARLVYTGALGYHANLDAVRFFCFEILPLIRREVPEVTLDVTGSTRDVDLSGLEGMDGVCFTGFVPDIRPVVAEAAALVVPARLGGGTRLKVLEAMALGTPVVATKLGGMGFGAIDGRHLLTADDPERFAHSVVSVIRDEKLAGSLSESAREFVRSGFGWEAIADTMDGVIRLAVEGKGVNGCSVKAMTGSTG